MQPGGDAAEAEAQLDGGAGTGRDDGAWWGGKPITQRELMEEISGQRFPLAYLSQRFSQLICWGDFYNPSFQFPPAFSLFHSLYVYESTSVVERCRRGFGCCCS